MKQKLLLLFAGLLAISLNAQSVFAKKAQDKPAPSKTPKKKGTTAVKAKKSIRIRARIKGDVTDVKGTGTGTDKDKKKKKKPIKKK
jgi:hypothetical protein